MKKQMILGLLILSGLFLSTSVFAQWVHVAPNLYTITDKVGIGTNTPEHPLYILNDVHGLPMSTQEKVVDNFSGAALLMRRARGTIASKNPLLDNDVVGGLFGQTYDGAAYRNAASLRFYADGNASAGSVPTKMIFQTTPSGSTTLLDRMIIRADGNVGIGTNNPTSLLAVNGKITAKEVEVTLDASAWPDYVFADDYSLMSLHEVEAFVQQNRHLPNVPSESDVANNGVNLGEISSILLQKVEELTLYVIELNKQNEVLQQRISQLEK